MTPSPCGTSYRGFSARPSPFPDATHNAFCRKIHHADRLCPRLFTVIAFQFPTESQPWAQRHVASIERRAFIFFQSSDPFRAIIATTLPHTARTVAQPYIARTIRSSHTPRARIMVAVVVCCSHINSRNQVRGHKTGSSIGLGMDRWREIG